MSASTIESRRISDPRFKLKNIIDRQTQQLADQINPDDLQFQDQTVSSFSRLLLLDEGLNYAFNGNVNAQFFTPFEPDLQYLTAHLYCDNTGNYVVDRSGFRNNGNIGGNPNLVDSININNGFGTSPSLEFDGATTYIDIINNTSVSPASYNTSLGFTLFGYIRPENISIDQYGFRRTIAAKSDGSSAYGYILCIDSNGDLLFNVKSAGIEYKVKAVGAITTTAVHQIIAVYDPAATPWVSLNVNNVNFTTTSTAVLPYPTSGIDPLSGDMNLHIGRADNTLIPTGGGFDSAGFDPFGFDIADFEDVLYPNVHGAYSGQLYDFRLYMRALTTAEKANIWTNKQTIYDVPLGQVALAGFSVSNP